MKKIEKVVAQADLSAEKGIAMKKISSCHAQNCWLNSRLKSARKRLKSNS